MTEDKGDLVSIKVYDRTRDWLDEQKLRVKRQRRKKTTVAEVVEDLIESYENSLRSVGQREVISTPISPIANLGTSEYAIDTDPQEINERFQKAAYLLQRLYAAGNEVVIDAIERNLYAFDVLAQMVAAVEGRDLDPDTGIDLSVIPEPTRTELKDALQRVRQYPDPTLPGEQEGREDDRRRRAS